MSILMNILASIGKDKWIHFTISLLIELFIFAVCRICGFGVWSVIPAFVIALGIGFIKEKIDAKTSGFNPYDIVADFLGCFLGVILISLMVA